MKNSIAVPQPTKEKGQRSLSLDEAFFTRVVPTWTFPSGLTPAQWRTWVAGQPVAVTCRDTLISSIISLDWKITPRDSEERDELKQSVKYHTRLFERGGDWLGLDWTSFLEWVLKDLQDLPFGTATEVGRKGDEPGGRVAWFKPLDGGTLFPTLNKYFPVVQQYGTVNNIEFPEHAINRMYLSPRTDIEREGWGMAPPEKIFLAMEMLARGDRYYANLLIDVPPAGILDLGDMEKDSALEWVSAFRTFVAGGGVDGFKIPVLYEHNNKTEFIPFGKVPNDIMFDRITLKYAALVAAAYGMSLNDIGLQGSSASGETLAGAIRSERRTRKTGLATLKKKLKFFLEEFLPRTLQFDFIDMDDELATALGRARLANATAWGQLIDKGIFSREEARLQTMQDGLTTISLPEKPPAKPDEFAMSGKPQERPGMLGSPKAPSQGGDGEVKKSITFKPSNLDQTIENIVSIVAPNVRESLDVDDPESMRSAVLESVFSDDGLGNVLSGMVGRVGNFEFDGLEEEVESILEDEGLSLNVDMESLKSRIQEGFSGFIGKAIIYNMASSDLLTEDFEELALEVKRNINKSLHDYISAHIGIEVQNSIDEMKAQELDLPEPLRIKSFTRRSPMSVVVNPPNISMPNISLPPITVNVPERSTNVESPVINVNPQPITVESPTVNVSVPERSVQVNVPEMSPVFNLETQAPIVNLSVPETQTVVNVTNEVNPTPVEVNNEITVQPSEVVIDKGTRSIHIQRDMNGNISSAVSVPEEE